MAGYDQRSPRNRTTYVAGRRHLTLSAVTPGTEPTTAPPAGTAWVGDWDTQFHDRVYGADPVSVGAIAALLTGVQHRDGSTVSGVAIRVDGGVVIGGGELPIVIDLTPDQARELGEVLIGLARNAEALDGIGPEPANR
jgi:hypothetical protein